MNKQEFHNMVASSQGYMYEAGKKAEHDRFWDRYQLNGNRVDYSLAFAGSYWEYGITFSPKYSIRPTKAESMFYASYLPYEAIKDVDFSNCTYFYQTFAYSQIKRIGIVDMRKATQTSYTFYSAAGLHTVDKVILSSNVKFNSTFRDMKALENITFEGEIGQDGFDIRDSTLLTKASITSIINCLSSATSGLSITLSKTAVNNAFTTEEWNTLKATKSNWEIKTV